MAKCGYCGSTIIGGVRSGDERFCNNRCHQAAHILRLTRNVPADVLDRNVEEVWRGNCPICRGLGPIEVHKFYEIWSALLLTRWTTKSQVSCSSCAVKRQWGALGFSFLCGWWGFPWGLVLTPVQITRNIIEMCRRLDSSRPSDQLRKLVLVNLGTRMLAQQQSSEKFPPVIK